MKPLHMSGMIQLNDLAKLTLVTVVGLYGYGNSYGMSYPVRREIYIASSMCILFSFFSEYG
eukprot:snap_masked-scaffold_17-processed-gene-2.36-mRNA-1 protein AED:1.00 eAED:1.00 QI:0/0/0/0/1/1/2/0/60